MLNRGVIGIIGGGNMGSSLVGGLIHHGIHPNQIFVADRNEEKCAFFRDKWHVNSTNNIDNVAKESDILILAVKPNDMKVTLTNIAEHLSTPKLLISIAAGITTT